MQCLDYFLITLWSALAAVGIGILIAGGANKIVIYYDGKDILNSFCAVVFSSISVWLFMAAPEKPQVPIWIIHWVLSPITAFIGLMCLIKNFKNAVKHNRNFPLGMLIGFFKLVFLSFIVLLVIGQLNKLTDKKSSTKDRLAAAIIIGISVLLAKAMINGPTVYESKGWTTMNARNDQRELLE